MLPGMFTGFEDYHVAVSVGPLFYLPHLSTSSLLEAVVPCGPLIALFSVNEEEGLVF